VLGGLIIQDIDWQWIFWINVPAGLVATVLCLLKLSDNLRNRPQLDLPGLGPARR
jgi:MFS family permease